MDYEIEFYGMIAEQLHTERSVLIVDPEDRGKMIRDEVIRQYPDLKNMTFTCAIDNKLCEVFPEEEWSKIAVLPPFAGG